MEDQGPAESSLKFLENTKAAIREKGGEGGNGNPKMADITIWALKECYQKLIWKNLYKNQQLIKSIL